MIPVDKNREKGKASFRIRLRRFIFGARRERQHSRYNCFLPAPMAIPERKLMLNGVILDISKGGVLWREMSNYIINRCGTAIKVCIDGVWHQGVIVVVSPKGYSIRFDTLMQEGVAFKIAASNPRPYAIEISGHLPVGLNAQQPSHGVSMPQ